MVKSDTKIKQIDKKQQLLLWQNIKYIGSNRGKSNIAIAISE